ncbi:hypothetical protein [Mammaliicoccus phage vB_MscM-PMS3]|nr:hypothetical protein [Mammaliicoccus phage vB_MscM-PMS3]WBF82173.1 hypothetical protein [Mammaliicoccus virus vB_MscM-PMS2]
MQHRIEQTNGLISFIRNIKGDFENNVVRNVLDDNVNFVSRYYTPTLRLSTLSINILKEINSDRITISPVDFNNNTIVTKVNDTNIKSQAPKIYLIIQTIVLEAYAIVNCFLENPSSLKYLTKKDVQVVRENINYVCDYLGDFEEYISVVDELRELDINFGYIENQIDIIKEGN